MQIDWFTFAAQLFNFALLVVLLKYLLYDRITKVMDKREEDLASRLDKAEETEKRANSLEEKNQLREQELEEDKDEMLHRAREEAEEERRRLSKKAREEVEEKRQEWLDSLRREQGDLAESLQKEAARQALAVCRRTLRVLADEDFQSRTGRLLASRLEELEEPERKELTEAIREAEGQVVLRTVSGGSESGQNEIARALSELAETEVSLQVEEDEDLIGGLELEVGGRRLAWSLQEALDGLETAVEEEIHKRAGAKRKG